MAVDSIYMTSLSATSVSDLNNPNWVNATATLTIYTSPQAIVWAQISIARQGPQFTISKAFIPRISIVGFGDLELGGGTPVIGWSNVESITFELDVSSLYITHSNIAPILIAAEYV